MLTRGWLVNDLTHSPFLVSLVPALLMAPQLVFTIAGGEIADRFDRRSVIALGETGLFVIYSALTALVLSGNVEAWHILALTGAHGLIGAIVGPSRQSLISDLVPAEMQRGAIGLSPAIFNVAQITGPAVGGIILATMGPGAAMAFSAILLVPALPLYHSLRSLRVAPQRNRGSVLRNVRDGAGYVAGHHGLRWFMLAGFVMILTVNSWGALFPTLVEDVLHKGAGGLATISIAVGFGALFGSLVGVLLGSRFSERQIEIGSGFVFTAMVGALAMSTSFPLSVLIAAVGACAATVFFVTNMVAMQMMASAEFRGRVISLRFVMFGFNPVGMMAIGALAEVMGVRWALAVFGLAGALLLGAVTLLLRAPEGRAPVAEPVILAPVSGGQDAPEERRIG